MLKSKPKDQEIGQGFIDLGRVFGYHLQVRYKDESPRKCGFNAVNLGIHQVTQPYQGPCQGHHDHDPVE